jgi:hypothetical protein
VLFCAVTSTTSSLFDWHKFKHDYNKHYPSIHEEAVRKQIFFDNVNQMRAYQRAHPDATFTLAINHLADRRSEVDHVSTLKRGSNYEVYDMF